jgi:hypothetical protein
VNRAEHYAEAERLLAGATWTATGDPRIAAAQVHATLALVDHQRDVAEHIKAAEVGDELRAAVRELCVDVRDGRPIVYQTPSFQRLADLIGWPA